MHVNSPLLDYDLFLAARSAPSEMQPSMSRGQIVSCDFPLQTDGHTTIILIVIMIYTRSTCAADLYTHTLTTQYFNSPLSYLYFDILHACRIQVLAITSIYREV